MSSVPGGGGQSEIMMCVGRCGGFREKSERNSFLHNTDRDKTRLAMSDNAKSVRICRNLIRKTCVSRPFSQQAVRYVYVLEIGMSTQKMKK